MFISLGILLGILYFFKRVREFGIDSDRAVDVVMAGILFSVVGGRLYYVIFSWSDYSGNLLSIFYIRQGGLAIYGAVIAALTAGYIMCRIRRVKFLPAADLASCSILLGTAIGRWGNFMNIEAFGSNTRLPWGMTSPSIKHYLLTNSSKLSSIGVKVDSAVPVHPTFLYESLWCLAGFAFLAWFTKHRRFDGQLSLIYIGWYGLGRFFIEGLRTDSLLIGAMRVSQMLAFICVLASAVSLYLILSKIRREGDDNLLPLYVNTEEGKSVLSGEFYIKPQPVGEAPADGGSSGDGTEKPEEDSGESIPGGEDDVDPQSSDPDAAGDNGDIEEDFDGEDN